MRQRATSIAFGLLSVAVAVVSSLAGVSDRVFLGIMVGTLVTLVPIAIQIDVVRVVGDEVQKGISTLVWTERASLADARIKSEPDALFRSIAGLQLAHAATILQDLSQGEATYAYGYEGDIILTSIERAADSVRATHDCRESMRRDLWLSDPLQHRYIDAQRDLLERRRALSPDRSLTIERTLVLPLRKDITAHVLDELAHIADLQARAGITVRAVTADDLNGRWDEDVVLIDHSFAHRYTFGVRAPYEDISVVVDIEKIGELRDRCERVLKHARPWSDMAKDLASTLRQTSATFYDVASRRYDDDAFGSNVPDSVRDFLITEGLIVDWLMDLPVPHPRVLFDFGCGTGQYLRRALTRSRQSQQIAREVIGIEISPPIADIASYHLRSFKNARVEVSDVVAYHRPLLDGETPVGLCTYNTIGVAQDPERFVRQMLRQCHTGWLFVSGFRGEMFAELARPVYSGWTQYVGTEAFSSYDEDAREYCNDLTGFRSKWLTEEELTSMFGAEMERCVVQQRSKLGYHLLFRL